MYQEKDTQENEVIIEVEDVQISCSREKLSKNSDYFDVMFNGNFTEKHKKTINIQEVKIQAFKNILNIIDEKTDFINYDQILDTLQCACMLQFEKIKKYCIDRLITDIQLDHCLEIWNVAEKLDLHPLCEFAKCRALIEFNSLRNSDSILQINIKQLHSYLANTLIYCDNDLDIFETGMKWWYENSNSHQKDTNKYLRTILSCVDFKQISESNINHMLSVPDISKNLEIKNILIGIKILINDSSSKSEYIVDEARKLFFDSKSRHRRLLPCVVSSEFPWTPDQSKQSKMEREMNLSVYEHRRKNMVKLFGIDSEFKKKCVSTLKGFKILPYKENLILLGGEYFYGSANWNSNVWIFRTFRNQWQILTKLPSERRHFKACIINDKLFVIGGVGKYRIKLSDNIMYYDLQKDVWEKNIQMPHCWNTVEVCDYKSQLFLIPCLPEIKFGFIFDTDTKGWVKYKTNFENRKFTEFFVFSKGDSIFIIEDTNFIETKIEGAALINKKYSNVEKIQGDRINYYFRNNELYVFTNHKSDNNIFQLHKFNLNSKKYELLIQINDSIDTVWHVKKGCFPFFHYNLTNNMETISEFMH